MSRATKPYAQLKGLDALFGGDASSTPVKPTEVKLSSIRLTFSFAPNQAPLRHQYDREEIQGWVDSDLRPNGIHTPILLRPHPVEPELFELIDGMTRYIAATEFLGCETISAVVKDLTDEQAFKVAASSTANRKKFTPLEYLDHALFLLSGEFQLATDDVCKLLYRLNNQSKKDNHIDMVKSEEEAESKEFERVEGVFAFLGQTTWKSFVSNYLPVLKLPPELLAAVRKGDLEYSKAISLSRVKDAQDQAQLLEQVTTEGLSSSELKERVALSKDQKEPVPEIRKRLDAAVKGVKKGKIWNDPSKSQQLNRLIDQIEALLG